MVVLLGLGFNRSDLVEPDGVSHDDKFSHIIK